LENSLNKPPRSGILVVCFQLGCELDQQSLVQAAIDSGSRLK